ncbi:hypothetical protein [Carboxylicivirga sp. RSCT41]
MNCLLVTMKDSAGDMNGNAIGKSGSTSKSFILFNPFYLRGGTWMNGM